MTSLQRAALAILFLFALVTTFGGVLVQELHHTAVFYAAMSRQMVETGDPLAPFRGDSAYLLKPPLALWWGALNGMLFGFDNFAMTLPSRLGGIGCAVMTWLLARHLFGGFTAPWVAALVFVTNSLYVHFTTAFRLDSLMTFGAMLILWGYLHLARARGAAALSVGITLSVFTKGPMILAMLLPLLPHAAATGAWRRISPALWRWIWLLALPGAWFGWVWLLKGHELATQLNDDFWRGTSGNASLSAFESAWLEYAVKPARRLWPWLPLFVVALGWGVARCFSRQAPTAQRQDIALLLLLFGLNFGIAWVKPDPDFRYLYAGLPLVAVLCGGLVARWLGSEPPRWAVVMAGLGLLAILPMAVRYNLENLPEWHDRRAMQAMVGAGELNASNTVVLVGSIPTPKAPRRNDPVPDWVYFYLGLSPPRARLGDLAKPTADAAYVLVARNEGLERKLAARGYEPRLRAVKVALYQRAGLRPDP